jgi:hypothetical protein
MLERGDHTRALLPENPKAAIRPRVSLGDFRRAVIGAVVDDEHLEVGQRLRRERRQRLDEKRRLVADGQQDGHEHALTPSGA